MFTLPSTTLQLDSQSAHSPSQHNRQVTPGLPHVHLWDFSRLSFVNTILSKRKLTWFVDNGKVSSSVQLFSHALSCSPTFT